MKLREFDEPLPKPTKSCPNVSVVPVGLVRMVKENGELIVAVSLNLTRKKKGLPVGAEGVVEVVKIVDIWPNPAVLGATEKEGLNDVQDEPSGPYSQSEKLATELVDAVSCQLVSVAEFVSAKRSIALVGLAVVS